MTRAGRNSPDSLAIADLGAIPSFPMPDAILDTAFSRANKKNVAMRRTKGERRPGRKGRSGGVARGAMGVDLACAKLDSVKATISKHCDRIIRSFPSVDTLHPFYYDLLDATVDVERMRKALAAIAWARKRSAAIASRAAAQIRRKGKAAAGKELTAAYGRISSVLKQVRKEFEFLDASRKQLRKVPAIDPRQPTVVIAGSPNVGKSLLVRKLSSGKPVVAPYPFTTRDLQLGHFSDRGYRFQVVDTPGLLDRPLAKRNESEKRAILALEHLPALVLFVVDPSERCGTTLTSQERLLAELRKTVQAPFVVVENWVDVYRSDTSRRASLIPAARMLSRSCVRPE